MSQFESKIIKVGLIGSERLLPRVFALLASDDLDVRLPVVSRGPGERHGCDVILYVADRGGAPTWVREWCGRLPLVVVGGDPADAVSAIEAGAREFVPLDGLDTATLAARIRTSVVRDRADTAVRENADRFRATFEQAAVGIGHLAIPDGRWIAVNCQLCAILGYPRETLQLMTLGEVIHPDDRDAHRARQARLVAGEIAASVGESRFRRRDGSNVWLKLSESTLRGADGRPALLLLVAEDITERMQAEEKMRQSQKIDAIGRLAGGIAHDFNNLLTSILGYTTLAVETLPPTHAALESLEQVRKAGERASALTRQLLAFSRRQAVATSVFEINPVIAEMIRMLRRTIPESITLKTLLSPAPLKVKADSGQIEQVVLNLVVNARDAMPEGGHLLVETRPVPGEEMRARGPGEGAPGPHVLLTVSDTGTGMSAETRARLFEPFFTTKPKGQGTGLGLATVYGIVRQSGGSIDVYSEPGRGTTFKVYLPRVEDPLTAAPAGPVVRSLSGTETILLVEDDDAVRAVAQAALARFGYTVLAANGPRAARSHATGRGPIHLILIDVVMPEMSGRELVESIQREHPTARALFMSGYTEETAVLQGIFDRNMPFLQKPFTPDSVARRVREVLDSPVN